MAASGHSVGLTKKFNKQKRSVYMNNSQCLSSDQNLKSYGQKTFPLKILIFDMSAGKFPDFF